MQFGYLQILISKFDSAIVSGYHSNAFDKKNHHHAVNMQCYNRPIIRRAVAKPDMQYIYIYIWRPVDDIF